MCADEIKWLAKRAAYSGLRFNQAQCLFDALYVADALAIEGGNVTAAAARAEFNRTGINRILRRTARAPTNKNEGSQLTAPPSTPAIERKKKP